MSRIDKMPPNGLGQKGIALNRVRVGLAIACLMMIGCREEKIPDTAKESPAQRPQFVTLALNWHPEVEHGGYYAALIHGYYRFEGLEVTIRPGGPGVAVIQDVAAGSVEFGVDNADKLLLLRAQQADVVSIMNPIQNSPRCIMVHQKSGLKSLRDLANMTDFTLAINQGQPFAQYMMKKMNLEKIRIVPFPSGVAGFLQETNYGQQAYDFSEPFLAEAQGGDPQCLMLSDIGFNTYTSVLLASNAKIEQNPDLVAKMTRASIRGWRKYLAEPEKTNQQILELNQAMSAEILDFGVKKLRAACLPSGFAETRLGEMSLERWQTLVEQMTEIGSIKPGSVKAPDCFTLRFLEAKSAP